ncbi:MAG: head-tail connector protein [Pseudomonadota bacterium]
MILTDTAPDTVATLPLDELSSHLRLAHGFADASGEDDVLERSLRAATRTIETQLGQAMIQRRFELKLSAWNRDGHAILPIGPVETLVSFALVGSGEPVAVTETAWVLQVGTARQKLTGPGGGALPTIPSGYHAQIAFDAGHGTLWAEVPQDLRHAVMMLAAHFYETRAGEEGVPAIPQAVEALIAHHRPVRL